MAKSMTDWSALKHLKVQPTEAPVPPPPPPKAEDDAAAAEVLAYFGIRNSELGIRNCGARSGKVVCSHTAADRTSAGPDSRAAREALEKEVAELKAAKAEADQRAEESARVAEERTRRIVELEGALKDSQDELNRLRGECTRLQGELRKAEEEAKTAQPPEPPLPEVKGLLTAPSGFEEAFEGELREMVVASLMDALVAARNGDRQRRATVLGAVLEENPPSGELARRRAQLKQILKDSGYYNDPGALEKLGFRLVSGHTHWKLEYADVRLPLAKTPSDHRAGQNSAAEMSNRCF